ncbi:MAG: ABC transporter permease [Dietzia sp.]
MGSTMIEIGPALAVAVLLFVVIGATAAWLGETGQTREIPWTAIRAALQLVALSLVIGYVADRLWLVAAFAVVMASVASWAAARRVTAPRSAGAGRGLGAGARDALWCAVPVALPPVILTCGLFAAGVVRPNGLSIIPVVGILLGNAMAVAGLAGRRAHDELDTRHGEVEAASALGFTAPTARMMVCREAAATSLQPSLDQTRTIGLVTIPGAFVGMVLGGARPWEAGVMQLFVSTGILACGAVALVVTTRLVAAGRL